MYMGSLRDIRGESLAEQNRIRALMKEGITLSRMSQEQYSEFIEQLLRQPPVKFRDLEGGRSRQEFALLWARSAWEDHRKAERDLIQLLGLAKDWSPRHPSYTQRECWISSGVTGVQHVNGWKRGNASSPKVRTRSPSCVQVSRRGDREGHDPSLSRLL